MTPTSTQARTHDPDALSVTMPLARADHDDGNLVRGVCNGLALALPLWMLISLAVWRCFL